MAKTLVVLLLFAASAAAQVSPHGNLSIECRACHGTDSWAMRSDAAFRHESTGFALSGQHASLKCRSCHEDLKFSAQETACAGCHADVHQGELGAACARCHNSRSWVVPDMIRRHQDTRFPLMGRHATAACEACHAKMAYHQYLGTPSTCIGCHAEDYQATVSPAHAAAGFSVNCQDCHEQTAENWNRSFDHAATGFPLTGAHAGQECRACHDDNLFRGKPSECVACHLSSFTGAVNPNHVANGFPRQCQSCHSTSTWSPATFSHATTAFPLTGEHAHVECGACHRNGQYAGIPTDCNSCHSDDFQGANAPNHVAGGFPRECQSCHTTSGWSPATFNHANTQFPLTGAHQAVACASCHVNGQYSGLSTACYDCHTGDFQGTTDPPHAAGLFPHECQSCHTTAGWTPSTFNHAATPFPLTGAHMAVACQSCHVNGQYAGLSTACYDCHTADFQGTTSPSHVAGNFPHECQSCHTTAVWTPSTFNHANTPFPLTGAHLTVACQSCHVNGQYSGLSTACYDCHAADFQGTTNPSHVTGNLPHECQNCHTTTVWTPSTFNHANTQFPLTGAHLSVACQSCHVNGQYSGLSTACYDCHTADFQGTTNPSHVTGNFPHECQSCHTTTVWTPSTFNHANTPFPLTGAHLTVACQSCHVNGQYSGLSTACYDCHAADFQGTTNPSHVAGNFPHECQSCHSTTVWTPSTFSHANTDFPLTGAHLAVACQSCHVNGQYSGLSTACYDCHTADFQSTTDPPHVTGNFPHDCRPCHTTTVWTPSTFNHANTQFPLTGAHLATACQSCHVNGQYSGLSTLCYDCHTSDFQGTTNPSHVAGLFPHECQTCHSTTVWTPSTFSHATTQFPLTGAHAAVACQNCHINGQYSGLSTACYDCHTADFQGTTNPSHVTGNFPHTCQDCHSTSVWTPSTFNHANTAFPLTGAHLAVPCASCHVNGVYSGTPTACFDCHAADFNGTTNPAHVAGGFSHDCTTCHATTGWSPATFNHGSTNFPLTGAHTSTACQSCHIDGNYQLVYVDCYQCHQSDYAVPTNPNHVTMILNHDCTQCHTTSVWRPSTMNHDTRWFRIYSGNHRNEWTNCMQCHPTPGNQADFTCLTCHSRSNMDQEHQGVSGYSYSSPACYSCHRNA